MTNMPSRVAQKHVVIFSVSDRGEKLRALKAACSAMVDRFQRERDEHELGEGLVMDVFNTDHLGTVCVVIEMKVNGCQVWFQKCVLKEPEADLDRLGKMINDALAFARRIK